MPVSLPVLLSERPTDAAAAAAAAAAAVIARGSHLLWSVLARLLCPLVLHMVRSQDDPRVTDGDALRHGRLEGRRRAQHHGDEASEERELHGCSKEVVLSIVLQRRLVRWGV